MNSKAVKKENWLRNKMVFKLENFYYSHVLDWIQACLDGLGNKVINLLKKICACLSEKIFAMCRQLNDKCLNHADQL